MTVPSINTEYLERCVTRLELALEQLGQHEAGEFIYEVFRSACVKEFELIVEQCGSLLRRRLRPFFSSNRQADNLTYKDIFRYAAKHGLISIEQCERWFNYRDHRNDTAHLYGRDFAEKTLPMLPQFAVDARDVARVVSEGTDG